MLENSIIFLVHSVVILLGKIQIENEQSAGNSDISDENEINNLIQDHDQISDHLIKHNKPETDEEFGHYLDGYFGDHRFEIAFNKEDTFLAYYIKNE